MWNLIHMAGILTAVLAVYLYLILPGVTRRKRMRPFLGMEWAHRGLHSQESGIPENSLAAFRRAVQEGKGIELDIHLTKDKKLVVFHDDTLERICGISGTVEEMTYEQLKKLELAGTKEKIPLLRDVLTCVNGRVPLLIEVKLPSQNTEICRWLVREMKGYRGAFLVQSFNSLVLFWLKKHRGDILRGQLSENLVRNDRTQHYLLRFCVKYLLSNCICRPDFISYRLTDCGNISLWLNQYLFRVPVAVWTVKNQTEMRRARRRFQMYIFENAG